MVHTKLKPSLAALRIYTSMTPGEMNETSHYIGKNLDICTSKALNPRQWRLGATLSPLTGK